MYMMYFKCIELHNGLITSNLQDIASTRITTHRSPIPFSSTSNILHQFYFEKFMQKQTKIKKNYKIPQNPKIILTLFPTKNLQAL